ncbi:DNA topoisomerase I [Candidatus Pacearchaeota archaeon]|nr:DNA topoisomerase I [Candidatus Pacearchaeota archaeon]
MVIKDFIPLGEVKQTVEKEVQEKPRLKDLVTIERPGKPTPADQLEETPEEQKKKRARKKKASAQEESVSIKKRDAILIITEKPQAAQKIAYALGSPRKLSEQGVAYYELEQNSKPIIVASAVGHLFNLDYKKGQKGWPIFELEWKPAYEGKAAFTKRYYDVLRKLASRASNFIIATDYDVEGEVIGWNVLRFICKQTNALRMKFSTLTAPELKEAFEHPEAQVNWGNAYAGEARHIIDWLYGINLSRALMSAIKRTGSFKILSIGRVQGPALKIIVEREKEIASFKPEPYWQVKVFISNPENKEQQIEFQHPKDLFKKEELERFKGIVSAEAETKKKQESTPPLHPFDLTTLQREAYRLHKLSPSATLQLAQKLYLDGLISYPRTSSQKIPDSIKPLEILKKLGKVFEETGGATRKKHIEGNKTDPAHPSIYPTGDFGKMAEQEEKIYHLIVKRFIACFYPDLLTDTKRIILTAVSPQTNEPVTFTASGLVITDKGWTAVYPVTIEESALPDISGKVSIKELKILEKETTPPNRYTPTGLVTLLEKRNLGTKTTRSMIIDTLFTRGYLDGKSIQATPLGMKLIDTLEKYSSIIIDENLTRSLEEEMEKIQEATSEFDKKEREVIEKAKKIIADIAGEFKTKEQEIGKGLSEGLVEFRKEQNLSNELMTCPACKTGKLRIMFNKAARRYFIACNAYPNCRQTYSLPPNALIKKADKICEADNFPKLLAIRKAKRPWEFCFNPECPIEKQKKEEWLARTNKTQEGFKNH